MTLATLTISATIPARTAELSDSRLTEFMGRTGYASDGELEVSHLSVLLTETVQGLALREGGLYVDGTTGEGGHSQAILQAEPRVKSVLGIDWDSRSLETAQSRLNEFGGRCLQASGNYADMTSLAAAKGISKVDGVLLDLGSHPGRW